MQREIQTPHSVRQSRWQNRVGVPVRGELILEDTAVRNYVINGTVRMTINRPKIEVVALWVELTSTVSCWSAGVQEVERIIDPATKVGRYWNFHKFIIGDNELRSRPVDTLFRGEYEFKFRMRFRGDEIILPPSLNSSLGQIQYFVVLTCKSIQTRQEVLSYVKVTVEGYHDLLRPLRPFESPLTLTMKAWNIRQFLAATSPLVVLKVRMTLARKGYLPEEQIQGWMIIDNPLEFVLEQLEITLQRRIIFHESARREKEETLAIVSQNFEVNEGSSNKVIMKEFSLTLPSALMPTSRTHGSFKYISINYYVQFFTQFKLGAVTRVVRGEQRIKIGTHRN